MGNSGSNEFRRKRHSSEEPSSTITESKNEVDMRRRATMSSAIATTTTRSSPEKRMNLIRPLKHKKHLLTNFQKSFLIKSWNHHSFRHGHGNENIGVRIYLKLFDKCPETKTIFGFENLNANQLIFDKKFIRQTKLFITIIEDSLKNLDNLESTVQPAIFALGGRHLKMRESGFKVQHWDVLAECMLECIIESQGIHKHRDTTVAWRTFTSWMIGILKDGFYDSMKMQRRSTMPTETFKEKLQLVCTNTNAETCDESTVVATRNRQLSVSLHATKDIIKISPSFVVVTRNATQNAVLSRV